MSTPTSCLPLFAHTKHHKTKMNNVVGQEMLKLFVVANSLVMFLTLAWPQMKGVFDIIAEFVNDKFGSTGELF